MDTALPPLKRFRPRDEADRSEVTDTAPHNPTLPAKKRMEAYPDYCLPDLNLPASSYCLPAKKRVWALPPQSTVESFGVSSVTNDRDGEGKPPTLWAVKKKRSAKVVNKCHEKLNYKVEESWKEEDFRVQQPKEERDPSLRGEENGLPHTEFVKEPQPLAGEMEAEVSPQPEKPTSQEVSRAEEPMAEKVPWADGTITEKVPQAEEPMAEEVPGAEQLRKEDLVGENAEEEEPETEGQKEYVELNAEELVKEELMTKTASETAEDVRGEEEDGVICAVCRSTDGDPDDPIVFCDGCDLMVHASCYGRPLSVSIPEGDWFCARCLAVNEEGARHSSRCCCLCPAAGGVAKPTTDGRWAHVLCALLVPEVFFRDPAGRDGVDLSRVPARRWVRRCCVCHKAGEGCVVDCSESKCGLAFHVSCAMDADLCIEYRPGKAGDIVVGFCQEHTDAWRKQESTGKFKFVPRI